MLGPGNVYYSVLYVLPPRFSLSYLDDFLGNKSDLIDFIEYSYDIIYDLYRLQSITASVAGINPNMNRLVGDVINFLGVDGCPKLIEYQSSRRYWLSLNAFHKEVIA